MKRICLFAGYHPQGKIADYVVYYIKALAELADVYYWADCPVESGELAKLSPYVKGAWAARHGKYDFGSWQEIVRKIGWEKLAEYDRCIFCNDSVFAPLFPLAPIFERAEKDSSLDAWALNAFEKDYFGSFFFVFNRRIMVSERAKAFFESVVPQPDVQGVIDNYEKKLPEMLRAGHFSYKVFSNASGNLFNEWKDYIRAGMPVLKIRVFTRSRMSFAEAQFLPNWRKFLQTHTSYPVELAENHLRSVGVNLNRFNSVSFRLKSCWWAFNRWRKKYFRFHFCKGSRIVVLGGITLLNNTKAAASVASFMEE